MYKEVIVYCLKVISLQLLVESEVSHENHIEGTRKPGRN
jgi:hypothetical protein